MLPTSRTLCDICRLGAFGSLRDLKFDLITFLQALVSFARYGAIVNEYIRSAFTSYKTITFGIVEPFHNTFQTFHIRPLGHASFGSESCLSLRPFCV